MSLLPPDDSFGPSSYDIDPLFARRFTIGWTCLLALVVIGSSPRLLHSLRTRRIWQSLAFYESPIGYAPVPPEPTPRRPEGPSKRRSPLAGFLAARNSVLYGPTMFNIPFLQLDIAHVLIIAIYYAIIVVCLLLQADLKENPNRAGFLSLAQLPAIFLFATKNNPIYFLLGRGYEKLNVLHRWSGRGLFATATVHGAMWINSYITGGIASELKRAKYQRGMAAYGILCMLVLLSLRPVRSRFYQLFYIFHVVTFVSFFILICYHTPYAAPWIYPALAFYGFDLFMRLLRLRVKDAILQSRDSQMTLIHIPDIEGGWVGGQHLHLRVFFGKRIYETHSFTICNAPPKISMLPVNNTSQGMGKDDPNFPGGVMLGARVAGDWTKALNDLAQNSENGKGRETVTVLIDGPYGGSSIDFGEFESVLLVSGGSGVTFTLGILDDLLGRCLKLGRPNGERTRKVVFVWYIRSFGAILWFEPMISHLARAAQHSSIHLSFQFYVTCLCDPNGLPHIPNSSVKVEKPPISDIFAPVLDELVSSVDNDERQGGPGGLAVGASGPHSLTSEAQRVVGTVGPRKAAKAGGVELHTELFVL